MNDVVDVPRRTFNPRREMNRERDVAPIQDLERLLILLAGEAY